MTFSKAFNLNYNNINLYITFDITITYYKCNKLSNNALYLLG